jgi:hypothetical protein
VDAHVGERAAAGQRGVDEPPRGAPNRQQCATISDALERSAAATIASAWATSIAIGFSTITCWPASRNAIDCSAWRLLGVVTTTASIPGSPTSSRQSVVVRGTANVSASFASDSGRQLAAATTSAPGSSETARA